MDTNVTPVQQPQMTAPGKPKKRGSYGNWVVIGSVVAVLVIVALGGLWLHGRHTPRFNENKNIDPNEYQAVFLTNGQVYFGKLGGLNNKYVTVSDIYYLQVQQGQSTTGQNLQNASGSTDTDAKVSLAKLGGELHGPEDKMYIASDQVLFWENLTNDGKVAQAIDAYQKSK